jgi:hypothetical protein
MLQEKDEFIEKVAAELGFTADNYYSASENMFIKNTKGDVAASNAGQ